VRREVVIPIKEWSLPSLTYDFALTLQTFTSEFSVGISLAPASSGCRNCGMRTCGRERTTLLGLPDQPSSVHQTRKVTWRGLGRAGERELAAHICVRGGGRDFSVDYQDYH